MTGVIEVRNLRKEYGTTVAVDNVSFDVQEGEIFGILGPNGAGKTTTPARGSSTATWRPRPGWPGRA